MNAARWKLCSLSLALTFTSLACTTWHPGTGGHAWSFACTRELLHEMEHGDWAPRTPIGSFSGGVADGAWIIPAVLVFLPVGVDLLLLPVTLPHDLWIEV